MSDWAVAAAEALIACEAWIFATRQVDGGMTSADRATFEAEARRRGLAGARVDLAGARVDLARSGTEAFVGCKAAGLATRQIDGGMTSSIEDERSERPASLWAEDQLSSRVNENCGDVLGVMVSSDLAEPEEGGEESRSSSRRIFSSESRYQSWRPVWRSFWRASR